MPCKIELIVCLKCSGKYDKPIFTSINEAINSIRICDDNTYVINVHPGKYKEDITICLPGTKPNQIKIIGDFRPIVGMSYIHDSYWNPANLDNLGGGMDSRCVLSGTVGNNTIMVSGSPGSNPNFEDANVKMGDTIIVRYANFETRFIEHKITAILNNVVEVSPDLADNLGNQGDALVIIPRINICGKVKIETPITLIGLLFSSPPIKINNTIVSFSSSLIRNGPIAIEATNSRLLFNLKRPSALIEQDCHGIVGDCCNIPEFNCVCMPNDSQKNQDQSCYMLKGGSVVLEYVQCMITGIGVSNGFNFDNIQLISCKGEPPVIYSNNIDNEVFLLRGNTNGCIVPRNETGPRIFGLICRRYFCIRDNCHITINRFETTTPFKNRAIIIGNQSVIDLVINIIVLVDTIDSELVNLSNNSTIHIINLKLLEYEADGINIPVIRSIENCNVIVDNLGSINIKGSNTLLLDAVQTGRCVVNNFNSIILGNSSTLIIARNSRIAYSSRQEAITKVGDNSTMFHGIDNADFIISSFSQNERFEMGINSNFITLVDISRFSNGTINLILGINSSICRIFRGCSAFISDLSVSNPDTSNQTAITVTENSSLILRNVEIENFMGGVLAREKADVIVFDLSSDILANGFHYQSIEESNIKVNNSILNEVSAPTTGFTTSAGGRIVSSNNTNNATIPTSGGVQNPNDLIGNYTATYSSGIIIVS